MGISFKTVRFRGYIKMKIAGMELKIADVKITNPCIVSKCNETATGMTIASRCDADGKSDVRNYPSCAKHYGGVYDAVSIGFGKLRGYNVAHYTELLK
jgi:hypothetical protein